MSKYSDPRDAVFGEIYELAIKNDQVMMLTADTGVRKFSDFTSNIPDQFLNVGIAEQNAMSVAGGLASTGKCIYIFGIGTFITTRCFEQIKVDICCMNRNVTIICIGTGYTYAGDGPTHYLTEDIALMRSLPNMSIWSPADCGSIEYAVAESVRKKGPGYIRLDKEIAASIYPENFEFEEGIGQLGTGRDLTIIATSAMTVRAIEIIKVLNKNGIEAGLIDVCRIKPFADNLLPAMLKNTQRVVILDEHSIYGGLGSIIKEAICDHQLSFPVKAYGIPDVFRSEIGSREYICSLDGLDNKSICDDILKWVKI